MSNVDLRNYMSSLTVHPDYARMREQWEIMRDTSQGEERVKDQGTLYLPPTTSMIEDGLGGKKPGQQAYDAYIQRARFPDHVTDAVARSTGDLHRKSAVIQVPSGMSFTEESMTIDGLGSQGLLLKINELQVRDGRVGLLVDSTEINETRVAVYPALSIINWSETTVQGIETLTLVVLDESCHVREPGELSWQWRAKFRFLRLLLSQVPVDSSEEVSGPVTAIYQTATGSDSSKMPSEEEWITPSVRGRTLDFIPFVFVNDADLLPRPRKPPLLPLARLSLSQYRGDADYRQQLHSQTQETLVLIGRVRNERPGDDGTIRVGAGAVIQMELNGDAKMVGPESKGIEEARTALENDERKAESLSGRLIANRQGTAESGEALSIRAASASTSLNTIAVTGEAAITRVLGWMQEWMGIAGSIEVKVNRDFVDSSFDPAALLHLMQAKQLGAPVAMETIHEWLQKVDFTSIEYVEELSRIDLEDVEDPPSNEDPPPDDPPDDPPNNDDQ